MIYDNIFAVVTPATDYALVDIAAVKDEFDITDASTDTRLARWILEAGAAIQGPLGIARVLRADTLSSQTFRGMAYQPDAPGEHFYPSNGGPLQAPSHVPGLRLRRYPIVSVSSIVEDGTTLDPAADYEIDGEAGLIYRLSGTSRVQWYAQLVVVLYVGGYVNLTDVPADIRTACLLMLNHRRSSQARDPMLKQISIPGVIERQFWVGSTGDNAALPPEVNALISGYRDWHV